MFLRDLRYSLLRRWYFVLAGVLATAGLGLATIRFVPATFEASASVVLLPPSTAVTDVGNPYLVLGGLSQAVDVLIHRATADAAQAPIAAAYPGTEYTVQRDVTTSGPIITVVVDGPTSVETMNCLAAVMRMVPAQLSELQNQLSVEARSRISVMTLSQDGRPTTIDKARTRALLAVVAAGLIATVLLVGLVDGLVTGRRRRSIDDAGDDDSDGDGTELDHVELDRPAATETGEQAPSPVSIPRTRRSASRPPVVPPALNPPSILPPASVTPAVAGTAADQPAVAASPATVVVPAAPVEPPARSVRTSRIRMAPRHVHENDVASPVSWPPTMSGINGEAPRTSSR